MHLILRLVRLAGLVLLVTCLVLFFQFNVFALQFVDSLAQGTGWIAFLVLCGLEVLGLFWLYMAWRPKRSKLVLKENPTDEERAAFVAELAARLAENPHVRAAGIRPDDPEFLEKSLALLDAKADEIIRSDARRIFLGTALAQNGRLDALIVFLVLARMVWRISALYNQRPTPAEIWSVYTSVSASAFVAFSIDALDIPQTVTESPCAQAFSPRTPFAWQTLRRARQEPSPPGKSARTCSPSRRNALVTSQPASRSS